MCNSSKIGDRPDMGEVVSGAGDDAEGCKRAIEWEVVGYLCRFRFGGSEGQIPIERSSWTRILLAFTRNTRKSAIAHAKFAATKATFMQRLACA